MFDDQARYARDVVIGRIELPSKEEAQVHSDTWEEREGALKAACDEIDL